jgi:hypothetical protein
VIHVLTAAITAKGEMIMTTMTSEENTLQAAPASESQETTTEMKTSKPARKAKGGAQSAKGATAKGKSGKKSTPAKKAPKAPKAAKSAKAKSDAKSGAGREGSKTAIVLDLIQRAKGATLAEIMEATSWQAHSVRGFISGTLGKKMGLKVESAKREDGTRFYSLGK